MPAYERAHVGEIISVVTVEAPDRVLAVAVALAVVPETLSTATALS